VIPARESVSAGAEKSYKAKTFVLTRGPLSIGRHFKSQSTPSMGPRPTGPCCSGTTAQDMSSIGLVIPTFKVWADVVRGIHTTHHQPRQVVIFSAKTPETSPAAEMAFCSTFNLTSPLRWPPSRLIVVATPRAVLYLAPFGRRHVGCFTTPEREHF